MNRLSLRTFCRGLLALWAAFIPVLIHAASEGRTWESFREGVTGLAFSELVSPTIEYSELRWTSGDDVRWASKEWDDSAWTTTSGRTVPSHQGIYWIRFHVRDLTHDLPSAAYLPLSMAYDFYWDGILVSRSGIPGNRIEDETPGILDNLFTLSEGLRAKGEHVVAMRVSNYRNRFPAPTMPFNFNLVTYGPFQEFTRRVNILPTLAVGAMFIVVLTSLVMWLVAARRTVLLLFAAACLSAAVVQALIMVRYAYGYTYDWLYPAVTATRYALDLLGLCLAALVIVQCRLSPWSWLWVVVMAGISWVKGWFGWTTPFLTLLLVGSTWSSAWAMIRGLRGASLVFGGLLVTTLMWLHDSRNFTNGFFLQDFLPTLLGFISAVALDLRDERHKARVTELTAARLEIELLKKNLQPHFMLNTLTAITEVIEKEPPVAVRLIEDLAEEFRALARISSEKQIPLGQELELCRVHLRVMSVRTGATLNLDTEGIEESTSVPPALFLTLIENAFAHQEQPRAGATFSLRMTRPAGLVRFTFLSPGVVRSTPSHASSGTGLRYVKARLEESFTGRWKLESTGVTEGWQTVIELGSS